MHKKTAINFFIITITLLFNIAFVTKGAQEKKQQKKPPPGTTDIIKLFGKDELYVNIKRINAKFIYYAKPKESGLNKIDKRLVHIIKYKSGKEEVVNKTQPLFNIPSSWRKIQVTEDEDDVVGLIELEKLEAKVEGSARGYSSTKSLENSAKLILKKKAALIEADIVLITKKNHNRAYGEVPSTVLIGIAYKKY